MDSQYQRLSRKRTASVDQIAKEILSKVSIQDDRENTLAVACPRATLPREGTRLFHVPSMRQSWHIVFRQSGLVSYEAAWEASLKCLPHGRDTASGGCMQGAEQGGY